MSFANHQLPITGVGDQSSKIDEARDAALIQVLDQAITPERKTKPKRSLIVLLTGLVAGFRGMLKEETKESLSEAIALILEDRRTDGLRAVPPDAPRETVVVE